MRPIIIAALDHRRSLEAVLAREKIAAFKLDLVRILNQTVVTGILLDPEYGLEAAKLVKGKELYFCLELIPAWGAKEAKALGAGGVKLLWHYRPEEEGLVRKVSSDCHQNSLKFLLEVFDCPEEKLDSFGADILKLQFPGFRTKTPWVLLSGGVGFEKFKNQLKTALRNGCSGVAVGRALWQDQVNQLNEAVIKERVRQLAAIVNDS